MIRQRAVSEENIYVFAHIYIYEHRYCHTHIYVTIIIKEKEAINLRMAWKIWRADSCKELKGAKEGQVMKLYSIKMYFKKRKTRSQILGLINF